MKQAANVLDLLEYFAREQKTASLADLSAHFGWPRSSTFNLIQTLVERGFLYEPKPRGGYYPTSRWLALAQDVAAAEPLPKAALALIRDLADAIGETVWIAAPSGQQAVLLSVIQSAHAVRYTAEPGRRVPIHATASGQAIMSQMTAAQKTAILRKAVFERFGEGTPMSVEEVEQSISASLRRGWFRSASAYSPDLGGVSVPLAFSGRIFSVTVAGPLFRIERRMDETAAEIHRAITRHCGEDYFRKQVPNLRRLVD
ncbi:IclR family transcriptional regulator [uncultured Paracoccus sp.]|uniref:IclR family transcriptional regulator n=1 Tax=uncultured Paracoccus sp. TaxID=189685 RepID=UPI00262E8F2A|nr:IclR family transcriptional regulator [uncultured Paracoccus sp.]